MQVRCDKNGGNCSYFTNGSVYEVVESYRDNVVLIVDDKGKEREVEVGRPTSHIQKRFNRRSGARYEAIGVFVEVPVPPAEV